jgi:hypothetical protein
MSHTTVRLRDGGTVMCAAGPMVAEVGGTPHGAVLVTVGQGQAERDLLRVSDTRIEIDRPVAPLALRVKPAVAGSTFPAESQLEARLLIRSDATGDTDVVLSPRMDGAGLPFVDLLTIEPAGGMLRVSVPDASGRDDDDRTPRPLPGWADPPWAELAKTATRQLLGTPRVDEPLRRQSVVVVDCSASMRGRLDDGSLQIVASILAGLDQAAGGDQPLQVRGASSDLDRPGPAAAAPNGLAELFSEHGTSFFLAPLIERLDVTESPTRVLVLTDDLPPDAEAAFDAMATRANGARWVVVLFNRSRFTPLDPPANPVQDDVRRLGTSPPPRLGIVSVGSDAAALSQNVAQQGWVEELVRRTAPDLFLDPPTVRNSTSYL